jgi:hypothetical protein
MLAEASDDHSDRLKRGNLIALSFSPDSSDEANWQKQRLRRD